MTEEAAATATAEPTEQTPTPTGDPFATNGAAGEAATQQAGEQGQQQQAQQAAGAQGEQTTQQEAAPELSEQEQALISKLAGPLGDAVAQRFTGDQGGEQAALSEQDVVARLLGQGQQEVDPQQAQQQQAAEQGFQGQQAQQGFQGQEQQGFQGQQGYDPYDPYGQAQQQQQYGQEQQGAQDPVLQHPVVQALIQQGAGVQQYLGQMLQDSQEQQLHTLAKDNPDLMQDEVLTEVQSVAGELAERAGRPELATDPRYVEIALRAVRASRATPTEVPAEEAAAQGASLETQAGASVSGEADPKTEWWNQVKGSGGEAFPT